MVVNSSKAIRMLRPFLKKHPGLKSALRSADNRVSRAKHSLARQFPQLIRPAPRSLTIAVTAFCNLRCRGCRYGRDFMVGEQLPLRMVRKILDDAREAGVNRVRFYGGEPILHPDLPEMVEHASKLGMDAYVNTNGVLLKSRIDALYDAGMRWATIGFYGTGQKYDLYTQRAGRYARLERSLSYVRERYGHAVELQLNWLLMRPSCNLEALAEAWSFAERFDMALQVNLLSYSLQFFTNDAGGELCFTSRDRDMVDEVGAALLALRDAHPERFPQSRPMIRAIPDLLMDGPASRIPCDAYDSLWVGADGTVQICDTAFKLGNANEHRLRDLLFTESHRKACRDAFALRCVNCHCKMDTRILKHNASMAKYA